MALYSYLPIHSNTLLYADNVFVKKYAHICHRDTFNTGLSKLFTNKTKTCIILNKHSILDVILYPLDKLEINTWKKKSF